MPNTRKMTSVPKMVTLSNGLTLSYVEQGDPTGAAVVLLPGLSDSWRSYERVLEYLPASVRVFAISLRGHGDSDKPESGYRTKDFSGDVADFLTVHGVNRAIIVGHSSASLVAQRFAIDYPGRAAGIVLEGSFATLRGRKEVEDVVASAIAPLTDPIQPDFVRKFQESTIVRPIPTSFMDTMVEEALKVPARVWREAFAALLLDDHTSELHRIKSPTVLIWGDRDSLLGREQQDVLLTGIPGARLVVYPGVGHSPHWEDPVRFARDIITFAESLNSSRNEGT